MLFTAVPLLALIPSPFRMKFRSWLNRYLGHRYGTNAVARAATKYITLSGTATLGSGTIGDPYQCPTPFAVATVVAAQIGVGNKAFLFRRGTRARVTNALKTAAILINQPNVTFGWYNAVAGDADKDPPTFDAFKAAYGAYTTGATGQTWVSGAAGGRNDGNTSVWSTAETTQVWWVACGSNINQRVAKEYTRYALGANLAARIAALNAWGVAGNRGWFWESNVLYTTNPVGTAELALLEANVSVADGTGNGCGINVLAAGSGAYIEGLDIFGFGMFADVSQKLGITVELSGGDVCFVKGCRVIFGPTHTAGQLTNDTPGGITVWQDCRFGACLPDGIGASIALVGYNEVGGHELFHSGCSFVGPLATESHPASTLLGTPAGCHTAPSDAIPVGLVVHHDVTIESHPRMVFGSTCGWDNVPEPSGKRAFSEFRSFCVGEVVKGYVRSAPTVYRGFWINCDHTVRTTALQQTTARQLGGTINYTLRLNSEAGGTTFPNNVVTMYNNVLDNAADWVHFRLIIEGVTGQEFGFDYANNFLGATRSANTQLWNGEFINNGYGNVSPGLENADARSAAGGQAGCGYFGVLRPNAGYYNGWSASGAPVDLRSPSFSRAPAAESVGAGVALPAAIDLEYDANWNWREGAAGRTIGPYAGEKRPGWWGRRPVLAWRRR